MLVQTKFFGEVDIDDQKVITLVDGLLGFEDKKKYVILYDNDKENHNISWLQSVDEQILTLPVVNPLFIKEDYNPVVDDNLLEALGDPGEEEFMVLVTMRISSDTKQVSCNLKAPIVINPKTLLGCQVIAENEDYPIHYYLSDVVDKVKERAGD